MAGEGSTVRRSKRLKNIRPEYSGLEEVQNQLYDTPKKRSYPTLPEVNIKAKNVKGDSLRENAKRQKNVAHNSRSDDDSYEEQCIEASHQKVLYRSKNVFTPGHFSSYLNRKNGLAAVNKRPAYQESVLTTTQHTYQHHALYSSKFKIFLLLAVVIALLLIILRVCMPFQHDDQKVNFDLPKLFPDQSKELWGMVSHGMSCMDPFIVLLVHNDQDDLAHCLAESVVKKVVSERSKHFQDPIIIDGARMTKDSQFLSNLRLQMKKQIGLVILHMEDLSADVAEDLHFILDAYTPWIPGGVYVLTLNMPNININEKPFGAVQSFLEKKWSRQIKPDNLGPLIARIGNFVSIVKTGSNPCRGT